MTDQQPPRVAVVVPAHNEEETLGQVLQSLVAQHYEPKQVFVVNDASTDRTAEVIAEFPQVCEIRNEQNLGLGASINRGLRMAREQGAEFAIVLHADCVPEGTHWIHEMVRPFEDPRVAAVVSQRFIPDRSMLAWQERLFDAVAPQEYVNEEGVDREADLFRDKCDAYRLSIFEPLGFFDCEKYFVAGEDTDLSLRVRAQGYRILQSGTARVSYLFSSHQRSLKSVLLKKALQYGQAAAQLYRDHGYDGLQARLFALCFISLLNLLLMLVSVPVSAAVAGFLWLMSWTTRVKLPFLGRPPYAIPLAVLVAMLAALQYTHGNLTLAVIPPAVCAGFALVWVRYALRSATYVLRKGDGWRWAAAAFFFALAWRLLSGIGYLKGWLMLLSRGQ